MGGDAARAPVPRSGRAVARLAHSPPPAQRGKSAMIGRLFPLSGLALVLSALVLPALARGGPEEWRREWPHTDFSRHSVGYEEIVSGGPAKDGIPAIDHPSFGAVADARGLASREPVVSVAIGGEARAYPLRVMIWHEIVNDTVGGTAIAVTWCPLCNSSVVFDRRVAGRTLSFGTTGKLRNSDLVMYDRETQSSWHQYPGDPLIAP